MMLREYRRKANRLADFLPWAALVGTRRRAQQGRQLPAHRALSRSRSRQCARLPNWSRRRAGSTTRLRRLGSGWAIFVEAQRRPALDYPDSDFPDPASALVEPSARRAVCREGAHFESGYFLTLLWMPPAEDAARAESWLYEGKAEKGIDPHASCSTSSSTAPTALLRSGRRLRARMRWLDDSETLTYLHSCVSTRATAFAFPKRRCYLDALLADEPLTGGLEPRLGRAASAHAHHGRFSDSDLPGPARRAQPARLPYRWSTRAILLDKTDATKLLTKIRRQWFAKRKSVAAILKEVMTNEASTLSTPTRRTRPPMPTWRCRNSARTMPAGLCHRHRYRLGRRSRTRSREAAAGREGHPGPRLHRHDRRRHQRGRGLARLAPRPCLRQCPQPPISTLNLAHMIPLSAVWAGRNGTSISVRPPCSSARPKARPRSGFPFMSATSATP
jgi:type IV secretory pathway VirB4 component